MGSASEVSPQSCIVSRCGRLPFLVFTSVSLYETGKIQILKLWTLIFFIPVINWLVILLGMFGNQRPLIFGGLIFWAILGGILLLVTKPKDNSPK